jgi:CTP:molybdopterin cytidylyltransferase MocA
MSKLEYTDNLMLSRQLPLKSVALILAGGRGTRLKDLTTIRAKPAVHFGGKFRIIDFALSNCINSGIRRIGVITQYQSHSLVQHIQRGWAFFNEEMNEFVDLLPAQQRVHGENWYRGTADAVTQNLDIIRRYDAEYVVILAGDHIYKQDYSRMLLDHVEKGRAAPWPACRSRLKRQARLASWPWMRMTKSLNLLKNRLIRPPCLAMKPARLPVWAFMCLMRNISTSCWQKTIGMKAPAMILAKILFPK